MSESTTDARRFVYETPCSGTVSGELHAARDPGSGMWTAHMVVDANLGGSDGLQPSLPKGECLDMGDVFGFYDTAAAMWESVNGRKGWSVVTAS